MPALDEHNLLPVGKTIPFGERWLQIVKRIGEGYTSVVYEGKVLLRADDLPEQGEKVAVKAFKPYMDRDAFRQEDRTLWDLTRLEPEAAKDFELDEGEPPRLGIELHVSPHYYGSKTYAASDNPEDQVPYIVMEYITGKEIPDLIDRYGKLPEKDAVSAMRDFFFILDILHTRLKKTLMDMKFENLWWQETDGRGRVRVMDLGTLSDLKPTARYFGNSRLDLMRAGIIFFRMLTGYGLAYSVEGLKEAVEPLLKQYPMSWGTRRIVRRLLHWKEEQRYTEAAEVFGELNNMTAYWAMNDEELLNQALQKIDQAKDYRQEIQQSGEEEDAEEPPFAYQARSMLGVIESRNDILDEAVQRAIRQADELLSIEDFLKTGRKFLDGGSYPKAVEHFKKGMYYSDEPAALRRWYYAASAAMELRSDVYAPVSPSINRALERMNRGELAEARQEFKYLPENVRASNWIQALEADCELYEAYQAAQKAEKSGQYQAAANAYEKAQAQLARLPNPEDVTVQELGDLTVRMVDMQHLEATLGEAERLLPQAVEKVNQHDYPGALVIFEEIREKDPRNPRLQAELAVAADSAVNEMRFVDAGRLVDFALQRPGFDDTMVARKAQVQGLAKAAWHQSLGETELFCQQASEMLRSYPENATVVTVLRRLIEKSETVLKEAHQPAKLALLKDAVAALPGNNQAWLERIDKVAGELMEKGKAPLRKTVDELVTIATQLMSMTDHDNTAELSKNTSLPEIMRFLGKRKDAYQQAASLLEDAARIGTPIAYRVDEVAALRAAAGEKIAAVETTEQGVIEAHEQERRDALEAVKKRWQTAQEAYQYKQAMPEWLPEETKAAIEDGHLKLAQAAFMSAHGYLQRYDDQDEAVKEILAQASKILDQRGEADWAALGEHAAARIQAIRGEFEAANHLFREGNYEAAAAAADRLAKTYGSSDQLKGLKAGIARAAAFAAWQQEHAAGLQAGKYDRALVESIAGYLNSELPAAYWKNCAARRYLSSVLDNIRVEVQSLAAHPENPRMALLSKQWLAVNGLLKKLP